jgi:hypothetical protein
VQTGDIDAPDAPASGDLPIRFGKLLPMPSYYGQTGRFTLLRTRMTNAEDVVARNRWLVEFELECHALHVVVRRVPALQCRLQILDAATRVAYTR